MALIDSLPHPPTGYDTMHPPAVGQSYVDPVFGTEVWRVTDHAAVGVDFLTGEYSTQSAINADGTILRAITPSGGSRFYSTTPPFPLIVARSLPATSPSDVWWHPTNPDLMYHVAWNGALYVYDVSSNTDTIIAQFPYTQVQGGAGNQLSLDGTRIAFLGNNRTIAFMYDIPTDQIVATVDLTGMSLGDFATAPSGDRVVINVKDFVPTLPHVYKVQGNALVLEGVFPGHPTSGWGHSDLGRGLDGDDYFVGVESWTTNGIHKFRLADTGDPQMQPEMLLQLGWNAPHSSALHLSANAMHLDGKVAVATYTVGDPDPVSEPGWSWPPYFGEVFLLDTETSGVERLLHHRSRLDQPNGDYYYSMPRVSRSHDGTKIVYASNFRQRITNPPQPPEHSDVYMLEVGQGAPPTMAQIDELKAMLSDPDPAHGGSIPFNETVIPAQPPNPGTPARTEIVVAGQTWTFDELGNLVSVG